MHLIFVTDDEQMCLLYHGQGSLQTDLPTSSRPMHERGLQDRSAASGKIISQIMRFLGGHHCQLVLQSNPQQSADWANSGATEPYHTKKH